MWQLPGLVMSTIVPRASLLYKSHDNLTSGKSLHLFRSQLFGQETKTMGSMYFIKFVLAAIVLCSTRAYSLHCCTYQLPFLCSSRAKHLVFFTDTHPPSNASAAKMTNPVECHYSPLHCQKFQMILLPCPPTYECDSTS